MLHCVLILGIFAVVSGSPIAPRLACNNDTFCGVQVNQPHTPPTKGAAHYIVGGREAIPHSWPWMVVLKYRTSTLSCGGSLIRGCSGNLLVVTAAQCLDGTVASDWTIDVGVHSRSANEANQKSYSISQILVHQNFSSLTLFNDIGILKPSQPITENADVHPICVTSLPTSDFYGDQCVVLGWGTLTESGSPADKLQEVYKPVLPHSQCIASLGSLFDPEHMMCAGYLEGGKGACQGDSGGPLACKNSRGQWDLIGIVSWGYGCAREGYPAVYADVHTYLNWLTTNA